MHDQDQLILENIYLEYINNPVGNEEIEEEIKQFQIFMDKYVHG